MTELPTTTSPGPRTGEGGSSLHYRGRIAVLHLRGNAFERGRQHGLLLREQIQNGVVAYFMRVFQSRLRLAAEQSRKLMARLVPLAIKQFTLNTFLFPRLLRAMPTEVRDELAGLSSTSGIELNDAAQTSVFPDIVLYFLGKGLQGQGKLLPDAAFDACTSFAAWGPATADGSFLVARNLDFFGVGVWDRHPAVFYHHPDRGQSYVSIASAGVALSGITAINQAGLTVAPQIKRTRAVRLDGIGMLYLAHEIARRAESLDDAIRIAREAKPAVGFSLVVTDARRRAVAAIECSAERVSARVHQGDAAGWSHADTPACTFTQTNHYTCPDQVSGELDVAPSIRAHSIGRYRRALELLRTHYGRMTPASLAGFLADHHDPFAGRERMLGSVITQPCNLTAAVFRPEQGEFWVAEGTAPVSHARFLRFTVDDAAPAAAEADALPAPAVCLDPRFAAYRHVVRAYVLQLDDAPVDEILDALAAAEAGDAGEGLYPYLIGLFALRAGRIAAAASAFGRATTALGKDVPHREQALRCWSAVARSLQGGWETERATFAALAADPRVAGDLRPWTETWSQRPPELDDLRGWIPDVQYGDAIYTP